MSETITTSADTPSASGPGLPARVLGVLFSPRETFAAVVARPRWFGVLAITLVVSAACTYVTMSSPELQEAIIDQQVRAMATRGNVSDAQIAGVETFIGYMPVIYAGVILVLGPVFAAIFAGIFMGVFTTLVGGSGTFKQVYAVGAHAGVISTLQGIFVAAMTVAGVPPSGVTPPGANLGVFVPMLEETSFVTLMLTNIDLFLLWWLVTLSNGLSVLYKRRTGPIASTLIGIYVVIALVIAFFRSGS